MSNYHETVLLTEAVELLNVKKGKWYVDATLGGGGHSLEIVKRGGRVLGIDRDQDALDYVRENVQVLISNDKKDDLRLVRGNFVEIGEIVKDAGIDEVAGVLFDFGVSGHQFDTSERGFSFQTGPLDMRMDQRLQVRAKDLIHGLTRDELQRLFEKYGEERFARTIARQIVIKREEQSIETTEDLVKIIRSVVPHIPGIHPATRVFQALRIAVNDELHSIEEVLPLALNILEPSGRIVTISFHSLEDRIVKTSFLSFAHSGRGEILTKKPIVPTDEEIAKNARSRSAKLRAFEKLA